MPSSYKRRLSRRGALWPNIQGLENSRQVGPEEHGTQKLNSSAWRKRSDQLLIIYFFDVKLDADHWVWTMRRSLMTVTAVVSVEW